MDIDIVNAILRLCSVTQSCLFEISSLCNYCLEQHLCTDPKYVLASVKNYTQIFKINRDKTRVELFMPFDICRNNLHDQTSICVNCHLCYDYFYMNTCRSPKSCPHPHVLNEDYHRNLLGPLMTLDLDLLSKAFRVYCQSKKYLVNSRGSQLAVNNNSASLSQIAQVDSNPCLNENTSRKTSSQPLATRSPPLPQNPLPLETGVQICWKPLNNIQTHFIEVIFSNQSKSNGGPIQCNYIFQHLGVAQVFYNTTNMAEQVVQHEPIKFQSFLFTSRLLQRTVDKRHVCLINIPTDINQIISYISTISAPYKRPNFRYYHHDKHKIILEYDEDIDFSKISQNVRYHPECNGQMITCIQLFNSETLLVEYDKNYSEDDIRSWFNPKRVFHIKPYSYFCFVHFYSHNDLIETVNDTHNNNNNKNIRMTPIYIDIFSEKHLNNYMQRRPKPTPHISSSILDEAARRDLILAMEKIKVAAKSQVSKTVVVTSSSDDKIESSVMTKPMNTEMSKPQIESKVAVDEVQCDMNLDNSNSDGIVSSGDDFSDVPSDFDNENLFLDDSINDQGDLEYIRSAAKNLMSSLSEMEEASNNAETEDTPHSLLYGDDYVVTIKNRQFTLAFLDYTQFRVDKQRNPDRFRLLAALKKKSNNKTRLDHGQQRDQDSSPTVKAEAKANKKKRQKRGRKRRTTNNNGEDNEVDLAD